MSLPTPPNTSHRDKENRLPPGSRISWSQQNQYHYLSTSPSPKQAPRPSGSRSPPPKSILKKTSHILLPFEDENETWQREATPEPADPLADLEYLASPVATIVASGDVPLRQVIEAYSVLTARLKGAVTGETDADASWPLFQPLRRNAGAIVDALVRDLGKALIDPGTPVLVEHEEERVLLPSPKSSPTKKKGGMTAEQVKYARDLCTTSHAVMKLLAIVFTLPAVYRVFTDDQLGTILTQTLAIPLAEELPTPNARKTCALAIWLIQNQRLPSEVLMPANDRIAYALRRGIEGELGKEGKKGSTNDGLKAIHDLSTYQPATFLPAFASLLPSILSNLLAPTLVLRTQACHALGGLVLALTSLPACSSTYVLHARLSASVAEFLMPSISPRPASKSPRSPASPSKDPLIIRTIRTTLQATEPQAAAQGPVWALTVLANMIVLLGPRLYTDAKLSRALSALLALTMRHKKSSVRGLGCLVWRCLGWVWLQPSFPHGTNVQELGLEHGAETEDEKVSSSREAFWRIVKSVVDIGAGVATIVALLNDTTSPSTRDGDGNLRRVMQIMRGMIKKGGQTCGEAMEILKIFVSTSDSPVPSSEDWTANKMLPPSLFNALPGLLSAEYKSLVNAIKPIFDQCPQLEDVRPLSKEDIAKEWVFDELVDIWRKGLCYLELPDDCGTPTEVVGVWEGLIQANVSVLQEAEDGPGLAQFAITVTEILIEVLQDCSLDLTTKNGPARKDLSSSSPIRGPSSTQSTGSLKLSIARDLWASVRSSIPTDHLTIAGEKFVACLVDTEDELAGETDAPLYEDDARKHWAMLCAEVLYLCDRDELRSFWGARRGKGSRRAMATWSKKSDVRCLVWAAFLHKWQEESQWDWEGAITLLSVPFVNVNGWTLSNEDFDAWDGFLVYAMNKALDYGVESSTVLDQVASTVSQNPSPAFTDSARIADLLLTHLEIAEARQVPTDLFEFINDILVSTYPPEPRNKVTSIWLLRSLTRVIGACPQELALQLFEIIRDGVAVWVTDSFSVFNREEYDDEIVPLYQTAVLSIQSLPYNFEVLETVSSILESAFCGRKYIPSQMLETFDIFWNASFASMEVPESGWPWKIQTCLAATSQPPAVAEELVIDPSLLAEDAAGHKEDQSLDEAIVILDQSFELPTPDEDDDDEPLPFPESEDEDDGPAFVLGPAFFPETATTAEKSVPHVFDFSHPPSTPAKFSFSLLTSTPPRPQKSVSVATTFLSFPLRSPSTPLQRTLAPATPKRTPVTLYSASPSSPSKRRKVDCDKENLSPRPMFTSFTERLARSPAAGVVKASVLGKRRALEEWQEGSSLKKSRVGGNSNDPRMPIFESEDSEDERSVEESLIEPSIVFVNSVHLDDPFIISEPKSNSTLGTLPRKRKRVVMDAVEVPSLHSVLIRDRHTGNPGKRTLRRTRSMTLAAELSSLQSSVREGLKMSLRKPLKRRLSEDPFVLSDPFSDIAGSDDSIVWSKTPSAPLQLSSDDDPHLGQVTPHHLISPVLRRVQDLNCDPPSDDSTMASSPSRDLAARRKQRMSVIVV